MEGPSKKQKKKYLEALKRIYDDVLFLAPYKGVGDIVLDVHEMLIKKFPGEEYQQKLNDFIRRNK